MVVEDFKMLWEGVVFSFDFFVDVKSELLDKIVFVI